MKHYLLFLTCIFSLSVLAQPILLPSIGIGPLPNDNEPVCEIPFYLGSFHTSGLQAGDTALDFTLYDLEGDSLNLGAALSSGRPLLLIAGSYTCPVFRNRIPVIHELMENYAGQIDVYVVYTLEAHPEIDTSVYFGYVNTTSQNISEGILYREPTSYGERKLVASDMINDMNLMAPVLIDGPCNNWWSAYGPAPNNSYLIDTNGVIFSKHGWFNKFPDNIYCDIDSLLGLDGDNCNEIPGNSFFSLNLLSEDTIYGETGSTISVDAELVNDGEEDMLVYARKLQNELPPGWASSMCIDVCYSSSTDSTVFVLPAASVQPVHVYFYTDENAGSGYVRMGFRNLANTANSAMMHAYGISNIVSGIEVTSISNSEFKIYPNPASSQIRVEGIEDSDHEVLLFNAMGVCIQQFSYQDVIDISMLPSGIYFIMIDGVTKKFIKL